MITSLAFVFLFGLLAAELCQKIKLPRLIGMLISGILLGPYIFNLLDGSMLGISADIRKMALVIILIKAGLSLDFSVMRSVGRPAALLSFVPACFEMAAYVLFAPRILGITPTEAAVMGAVLSAVSPAVVVPRMVKLLDDGYKKSIPQMILAGASLDDIFVIVLFTAFLGMAQGNGIDLRGLWDIPSSIIGGIVLGLIAGYIFSSSLKAYHAQHQNTPSTTITILTLSIAFLLLAIEEYAQEIIAISGLLAIMSMAFVLSIRSTNDARTRLQGHFGKMWIAAEVLLFVLVGAAVDIRYAIGAGAGSLVMVFAGLLFRSVGVLVCTFGTALSLKERIFCVIAYIPKATVQAAIGAIPLSMGLSCGNIVLSVAVVGILITAPLGAIGIDYSYKKLLQPEGDSL